VFTVHRYITDYHSPTLLVNDNQLMLRSLQCFVLWKQSMTTSFHIFCGVYFTSVFVFFTTIHAVEVALLNRPRSKERSSIGLRFLQYYVFNPYYLYSCRLPRIEEARFRYQASKYWIFYGPSRTGTGFTAHTLVFSVSNLSFHRCFILILGTIPLMIYRPYYLTYKLPG
jgi:hypothetical protein